MFRIIDGTIEVVLKKGARVSMSDGSFREPPDLLIRAEEPHMGPWDAHRSDSLSAGDLMDGGMAIAEALWCTLPNETVRAVRDELIRRFEASDCILAPKGQKA